MAVDIEKIINGTPLKRITNGYNLMKEDYNEDSAQNFFDVYSKESLSSILESSHLIFSEPYKGLNFYREKVLSTPSLFTLYESEINKVRNYIEENSEKMGETQKALYESLLSDMNSEYDKKWNTIIIADYIKENIDDSFETKISDLVYEYVNSENKDDSNIISLFNEASADCVYTYSPYVSSIMDSTSNMNSFILEKYNIEGKEIPWNEYVESVSVLNKLSVDKCYKEALNNFGNFNVKNIFLGYINESISNKMDSLMSESTSDANIVYHESPQSAVLSIFDDIMEADLNKEENDRIKSEVDEMKHIAYEKTLQLLTLEYQKADDLNKEAKGYSMLEVKSSIEDAYKALSENFFEVADDEDVSDEDIDSIGVDDEESSSAKKSEAKKSTPDTSNNISNKKPEAPKPKNLANRIQFAAQDAEVKADKKIAASNQRKQEIGNAIKAFTKLPRNFFKNIKADIQKIDEMDDDRRKRYMTEPGFRKKAFRNLKLAILYGSAASVSIAYIPIVMIARHFSKEKDSRMRNELMRELQTEIKVCDAKIEDAQSSDDRQEKYRLIRIKDKLQAELDRVKYNSKYI